MQSNPEMEQLQFEEDSVSLNKIVHVFWLRRRIFLSSFFFVAIIGVIILFQLTPRYTAENQIMVGANNSQVVDVESVLSGGLGTDIEVRSEVEVLKSKGLVKKVVRKLSLQNLTEFNPTLLQEKGFFSFLNPINWLADEFKESIGLMGTPLTDEENEELLNVTSTNIFMGKLKILPVRRTKVITVSFESTNRRLAAKIVNTFSDTYIINQLQVKFDATEKASTWLNQQLLGLRKNVEASENAVEFYRKKHNLTEGRSGIGLLTEQLSDINSRVIIAKVEKAEVEARLRQVTRLLRSGSGIETVSEVLSSPLIQRFKEQESDVTRKMSEMAVVYGKKHPLMIRVKADIGEIQSKITSEIRKIAAGLKNKVEVAQIREQSLKSSLKALENKTGSRGGVHVQLRALQREADANRTLFETFLNRFKETSSTKNMQEADARVISYAEVPIIATFPKKKLMVILILVLAFIISSLIIYLVEMMNPGFRSPEEIEESLGIPVMALVPLIEGDVYGYVMDKPHSAFSEALNSLRVSLTLSNLDSQVKLVLVTSSVPSEGKSTLALCLARVAARSGQKVLIVDADLRRPSIERKLGNSVADKGLTDLILSQEGKLTDYVFEDEQSGLHIMAKGTADYSNPIDIFLSERFASLLKQMKSQYDLVIFDTPPVMAVADAKALSPHMDKMIFVVRWDNTPRKVIKSALNQLEGISLGVVLQRVDFKQYGTYGYGDSGYYYQYSKYSQYYSN